MAQADLKDKLQELLACLPEAQQRQLLEFAEFLSDRYRVSVPTRQKQDIPRPEEETVVAAMKRLRETYPMLDPEKLLHEASGLMSAHMLQGRSAADVIDELEQLFQQHYDTL